MISLETARKYLKLTTTIRDEDFKPFVADAVSRYIRPYLGQYVVEHLWLLYDNMQLGANKVRFAKLMGVVEAPLARFTFLLAAPSLDINIGQSGFTTASGANMVAASRERVTRFTDSMNNLGYDGIEVMLRWIFAHRDDYPEWTGSEAYTAWSSGFVRSAEVFNRYVNINGSYYKFFDLNQHMDSVELLHIEPLLGSDLYNALLAESVAGTATGSRAKAIALAERAVATQVASERLDTSLANNASLALNALRDHVNAYPAEFPELFAPDAITERAPYTFRNTEDSPLFYFGG